MPRSVGHLLHASAASLMLLAVNAMAAIGQPTQHEPSIALAARQSLLDYAAQQGLQLLQQRVQQSLSIPDLSQTFSLPVVGDFTLNLDNIRLRAFNISMDGTRITILNGVYELWATQASATLTFSWHWEKFGMSGSGDGELNLSDGNIDYRFQVVMVPPIAPAAIGFMANPGGPRPAIEVISDSSSFGSVQLSIHSYSADWLYQAVLNLFQNQIQAAIQRAIAGALEDDVPSWLNNVLGSLPTSVNVTGLPFSVQLNYTIYTLDYVLIKGYGQVESDSAMAERLAALGLPELIAHPTSVAPPRRLMARNMSTLLDDVLLSASRRLMQASKPAMADCPFASSPLPLAPHEIGNDPHMMSVYVHQSLVNCLLWGLHRSGALQATIQDGTIPKLHITTDLLAMLIPGLPKAYPKQFVRIEAAATSMPNVSFTVNGTMLNAAYRASVYVANDTLGNPLICTVSANVGIVADVGYDKMVIRSVVAQHIVEESSLAVNPKQWDNTIGWFITNYGGLFPIESLINQFVKAPVASKVNLVNTNATTGDAWYTLSADVQLLLDQPSNV